MRERLDILITGGYGGNLGDDCLMATLYSALSPAQYGKVGFLVADRSRVAGIIPQAAVCYDHYQNYDIECDKLLYGGGTLFFDFGRTESRRYGNLSRYLSEPREFLKALRKKLCRKTIRSEKVYYFGIGIGPFLTDSEALSRTRAILDSARYVTFRDDISLQYYGRPGISVGEDICYCSYFEKYLPGAHRPTSTGHVIGLVVRDWVAGNGNTYIDHLLEMTEDPAFTEYEFVFFVFSEVTDRKIVRLLKKRGKVCHTWNNKADTIQTYLERMSACHLIISSRFHGLVFSALMNIPFIGIDIDPKLEILARKYVTPNVPELFMVGNDGDIKTGLCRLIRRSEELYGQRVENIRAVNTSLRARSDRMVGELLKKINDGKK